MYADADAFCFEMHVIFPSVCAELCCEDISEDHRRGIGGGFMGWNIHSDDYEAIWKPGPIHSKGIVPGAGVGILRQEYCGGLPKGWICLYPI